MFIWAVLVRLIMLEEEEEQEQEKEEEEDGEEEEEDMNCDGSRGIFYVSYQVLETLNCETSVSTHLVPESYVDRYSTK